MIFIVVYVFIIVYVCHVTIVFPLSFMGVFMSCKCQIDYLYVLLFVLNLTL